VKSTNRDDDAHREHVEENRRKDEHEGGLAPPCTDLHPVLIDTLIHHRRFLPA
jgi:hypothetical protein